MDNIKVWLLSLCGALAVTSIFRILVSNSNLKKSVNIFLSMFLFLYSLVPLGNVFEDIKLDNENYEENDYEYNNYNQKVYEEIIKETIKKACIENNTKVISMSIDSYIDDNDYCVIKNIELIIENKENCEKIKNVIKDELGYEVNVY